MISTVQMAGKGVDLLEKLVSVPKIYRSGDPTIFVPVGRYSTSPGWCFLPWKGIEAEYRWGFKARTEVSDYVSVLIGLQAAFLANESEAFWVIKNGKRVRETQRRARWRDGGAKPNLLRPWGWLEVHFEKLETLGQDHLNGAVLDLTAEGFEGGSTLSFGQLELGIFRAISAWLPSLCGVSVVQSRVPLGRWKQHTLNRWRAAKMMIQL